MNRMLLTLVLLIGPTLSAATEVAPPEFGSFWHDGKAELDGYRLTIQRYGHSRSGRAVAIYVTEPFSRSMHVKLDEPARTPADVVEVLKLNLARDFQTGIYDYHTVVSLFSEAQGFAALKTAFSSSEWCGQVYEELNVKNGALVQRLASYFEGESGERTLPIPQGGVQEDQLFVLLRDLAGPWLERGGQRDLPFLASPLYRRLAHRPAAWGRAMIRHLSVPSIVRVPAGSFSCEVYEVRPADGRVGRFEVEQAYPHRVVRWSWTAPPGASPLGGTDGGELTGTKRLAYWKTHDPGDESLLKDLGLRPLVP